MRAWTPYYIAAITLSAVLCGSPCILSAQQPAPPVPRPGGDSGAAKSDSLATRTHTPLRGPLDAAPSPFVRTPRLLTDSIAHPVPRSLDPGLYRGSARRGAVLGALVGGGLGLAIMLAAGAEPCGSWCRFRIGPREIVAATMAAAALGAGTGALIGSGVKRRR